MKTMNYVLAALVLSVLALMGSPRAQAQPRLAHPAPQFAQAYDTSAPAIPRLSSNWTQARSGAADANRTVTINKTVNVNQPAQPGYYGSSRLDQTAEYGMYLGQIYTISKQIDAQVKINAQNADIARRQIDAWERVQEKQIDAQLEQARMQRDAAEVQALADKRGCDTCDKYGRPPMRGGN